MTDDDKPTNRFVVEFRPPAKLPYDPDEPFPYHNKFFYDLLSKIKILPRYAGSLNPNLCYEVEIVLPEGCVFKAKWWEHRSRIIDKTIEEDGQDE